MWRHPTERAWSAYKFIREYETISHEEDMRDELTVGHNERYYPRNDLPWDEHLYTLSFSWLNPYLWGPFIPQNEFCKYPKITTMIPWDFPRMSAMIEQKIPQVHMCEDRAPVPDITSEMQAHLHLIYGKDYQVWDSIA